jgi:DNA-binding NarL/FixJ family response regulator
MVKPVDTTEHPFARSVVVVEDDSFMRSLIAEYLEKAGFHVTTAGTAVDARRQIRAVDPDAVVLDIDLGPGPTGLDLAKTINSAEVGLVFLTNFSDPRFAGYDVKAAHPKAAYLNKHMLEDSAVLLDALNAVLLERNVEQYRFDSRDDRPMAQLSNSQIQALRLLAEGKTNQQIADVRQRSLAATESLVSRTLTAIGIDPTADHNSRVVAAMHFITRTGTPPAGKP